MKNDILTTKSKIATAYLNTGKIYSQEQIEQDIKIYKLSLRNSRIPANMPISMKA